MPGFLNHRIGRYLFVGGFSYFIEMLSLYGLHVGLGVPPTISVAISFWIGFVVAYALQKIATFENYDRSRRVIAKQLIGYSLLVGWNYSFTLLTVGMFERHTSVFLLRTIVIIITTLWNYAIYELIFAPNQDRL